MAIPSERDQPGEPVPAPSDAVLEVHERILGASQARSRYIEVRSGRRVHVIEVGEGSPVLFLHGNSTSSLSFLTQDVHGADRGLPLLERLEGVRAIAVDRPGFGLSEAVHVLREGREKLALSGSDRATNRTGDGPTYQRDDPRLRELLNVSSQVNIPKLHGCKSDL